MTDVGGSWRTASVPRISRLLGAVGLTTVPLNTLDDQWAVGPQGQVERDGFDLEVSIMNSNGITVEHAA